MDGEGESRHRVIDDDGDVGREVDPWTAEPSLSFREKLVAAIMDAEREPAKPDRVARLTEVAARIQEAIVSRVWMGSSTVACLLTHSSLSLLSLQTSGENWCAMCSATLHSIATCPRVDTRACHLCSQGGHVADGCSLLSGLGSAQHLGNTMACFQCLRPLTSAAKVTFPGSVCRGGGEEREKKKKKNKRRKRGEKKAEVEEEEEEEEAAGPRVCSVVEATRGGADAQYARRSWYFALVQRMQKNMREDERMWEKMLGVLVDANFFDSSMAGVRKVVREGWRKERVDIPDACSLLRVLLMQEPRLAFRQLTAGVNGQIVLNMVTVFVAIAWMEEQSRRGR